MPNEKNQNEVKLLEEKLTSSSAVYLADYAGLSVKDQVILRDQVRAAGGDLRVTKNRLLKIAMKNVGLDTDALSTDLLGPNITLFAGSDPVTPLKALVDFAVGQDNEKPAIKIGVYEKNVISLDKVKQLASLPGRDQLIAKLIYTIKAPLSGIANVLAAPTRNLVYALSAIQTKRGNEASN